MKIPTKYILYFFICIVVGLVVSFGYVGLTYHPVPLQVPLDQYKPVAPPSPAMPTLAPQYVPGSYADGNSNTSGDKFAPAPAPVVVTTQPLPTITPVPTAQKNKCVSAASSWNVSGAPISGAMNLLAAIIPIAVIGFGIFMIVVGSGCMVVPTELSSYTTSMNTTQSNIQSSFSISGMVSIIIAFGGVMMALYILSVIAGSISNSVLVCTP